MRAVRALITVLAASAPVTAQVVPEAATCPTCTIQMRALAKIGTAEGPGSLPGRPFSVRPDSKGRYWVGALDYHMPLIYGADGKFIRELGKKGSGPGEFQYASLTTHLPGDSALISAPTRGGYIVIGADFKEARAIRLSGLQRPRIVSWPDKVIAYQSVYNRGTSSHGIRLFDLSGAEGKTTRTFLELNSGSDTKDRSEAIRLYAESMRTLATPAKDHIWIAQMMRYKILRYGMDGTVQDSIIREPSWFKGLVPQRMGSATTLPTPYLTAVEEDPQGRLWVFLAQPLPTASKAWKESGTKTEGVSEMSVASMPAPYTQHRTLIEVVDPKTKRVLARQTFNGFITDVIAYNRVSSFTENADGIPTATVWELSLQGIK